MKKLALILLMTIASIQSANACKFAAPIYTFLYQNDRDGDGTLNKDEWKNARLDDNLIAHIKLKKTRHLLKVDTNKNGVFDSKDDVWQTAFEYKVNPCQYWQQKINEYDKNNQESPND